MRKSVRMKGRKVRNLSNGKWYTSKRQAASATLRSERALARVDPDLIMKCTVAGEKAIDKRIKSFTAYHKKRPEHIREKARNFHRRDPSIRKYTGAILRAVFRQLQTCQDGRLVQEVVMCKREKSVGVVNYRI